MTYHQPVPCPPPWYQPASQCFDQVKQFEELLQTLVDKSVTDKLNAVIQQGALPPGVVDGSNAKQGQVGEFMMTDIAVPFAAYPAVTDTTVSLVVVPAGDWDMRMNMDTASVPPATPGPVAVGAFSSWINNPPAGLSNQLTMVQYPFVAGMTADSIVALNSCVARGNFSLPTLLSVRVVVNQAADPLLLGGQVMMHFEARRMR